MNSAYMTEVSNPSHTLLAHMADISVPGTELQCTYSYQQLAPFLLETGVGDERQ